MDLFQLLLGIVLLFLGGVFSSKNKDKKNLFIGLVLIIVGIALTLGGLGIKNGI